MKIWILEIGEPLPLEKDVRLHRYGVFTQALARMGHEVTWWTSSFSHAPKQHFADQDQQVMQDGVRLYLIRGTGYSRNVSWQRIQHNRHFAKRFRELARREPQPDLIICPIPIIEAAREAVRFGRERNIPVLTDIRDLWPDELRDHAPKALRWLARMLLHNAYQSMNFVCKNVTGIMAISESYLEYGLRFAGRDRGPNDLFFPLAYSLPEVSDTKLEQARSWCLRQGVRRESFIVCFFGTIGHFFDLETVIKAAQILEKEMDIQFVLAGAGSELKKFVKMASGTKSVVFPGWVDAPKIRAIMSMAAVGLAPYRKDAKMALPNKPFEYMAGKLAVLSSISQPELPKLLESTNCGLSYRADSTQDLVAKIRWLAAHRAETKAMGERGHKLWAEQFSAQAIYARIEGELRRIAGNLPPAQTSIELETQAPTGTPSL